jgi:hypothetical protein
MEPRMRWFVAMRERVIMLVAEGWRVSLNGWADWAWIYKGDELYSYPSYEFYAYAATVVKDRDFNDAVRRCQHEMWHHADGSGI